MSIKVAIVGNCQARPLATILPILNRDIEVIDVAIVHLLKSEQFEDYKRSFESADFIIAQLVNDDYPCNFVRTSFLRGNYGNKLIGIVNLYFSGYTPDWFYIRIPGHGPLRGPMGDYQNRTIFEVWKRGLTCEKAAFLLQDKDHNQQFSGSTKKSIMELAERELSVDIPISDFIHEKCRFKRLFFTFNHPSISLIIEYAKRILNFIELNCEYSEPIHLPEVLNQFNPRLNPAFNLFSDDNLHHTGVDYDIREGNSIVLTSARKYDSLEISASFFRVYDTLKEEHNLYDYSGSVNI